MPETLPFPAEVLAWCDRQEDLYEQACSAPWSIRSPENGRGLWWSRLDWEIVSGAAGVVEARVADECDAVAIASSVNAAAATVSLVRAAAQAAQTAMVGYADLVTAMSDRGSPVWAVYRHAVNVALAWGFRDDARSTTVAGVTEMQEWGGGL